MAINYSAASPYSKTSLTNGYLDVINFRDITPVVNDNLYQVPSKYEHRPDLLAYELYGDSKLWWVFAVRNKSILKDPIYDLVSGVYIHLPQLSTLKKDLGI